MIAYEIQLRCVIRDKIQSETKSDNFFSDKISFCWEKIFIGKNILLEKKILRFCLGLNFVLDFQCALFELSQTNRCLSSQSGIYVALLST